MRTKFTLIDEPVKDSLEAVAVYRVDERNPKLVVLGGIATQVYTYPHYPHLVRPTHDLDLELGQRLDAQGFREGIGGGLANQLDKYHPLIRVSKHVHQIQIEDSDGDPFFLHAYKWSKNGFNRASRHIEREVSNANQLLVPDSDNTIFVVRPEDIMFGKVNRLREIREEGSIPEEDTHNYQKVLRRDWCVLAKEDLPPWLLSLIRRKKALPAFYDSGEEGFRKALNDYRASKDLFDIALLALLISEGHIEFDERYYEKTFQNR